jgi:hypothetical protein
VNDLKKGGENRSERKVIKTSQFTTSWSRDSVKHRKGGTYSTSDGVRELIEDHYS